jgi:hypothetical protein
LRETKTVLREKPGFREVPCEARPFLFASQQTTALHFAFVVHASVCSMMRCAGHAMVGAMMTAMRRVGLDRRHDQNGEGEQGKQSLHGGSPSGEAMNFTAIPGGIEPFDTSDQNPS